MHSSFAPRWLAACGLALSTICSLASAQSSTRSSFQFNLLDDKAIQILEGGKPVLVYNYGDIAFKAGRRNRTRAAYIHPLYGLDGEVLTDEAPSDHYHHHGLFWGWPHTQIGGREFDFWNREDLRIQFKRWLAKEAGPDGAKLGVENAWVQSGNEVAKEEVWIDIHPATGDSRSIDLSLTWTPTVPITLAGAPGKSYGGFAIRYAPRKRTVITVPTGRASADLLITQRACPQTLKHVGQIVSRCPIFGALLAGCLVQKSAL